MSYVLAGYGITAVVLAGYAVRLVRRGRAISRILAPPTAAGRAGDSRDDRAGRPWQ